MPGLTHSPRRSNSDALFYASLVSTRRGWYCLNMDFAEIRDDEDDQEQKGSRFGFLRGFIWTVVLLLCAVLATAALMPSLLSSDAGRKWVLAKINAAAVPAQVSCEAWSLGWFRAPVLEKVGYRDPARGVTVRAEQIAFDRGLLRLLPVGVLNAGQVTMTRPDIRIAPGGAPVQETQEKKKQGAGKKGFFFLPVVDAAAVLNVVEGRVEVSGPGTDTPFVVRQADGSVTLVSIRKPIAVQVRLQTGGGTVALEGRVQSIWDLYKGRALEQPERLTLKLVSVDLKAFRPLLQILTGTPWIHSGVAEGALTALIESPQRGRLEGGLLVNGLSVSGRGQAPSPKGDVALLANLSVDKTAVQIEKFEFTAPWLKAAAKGTLQPGTRAGMLTGAITADATVHLAAVTRDFAPLLGLSKGFKMRHGDLQATVALKGSEDALRVDAQMNTAGLDMTVDGEPLTLKPAPSLTVKASFPYSGAWPTVDTFHLAAPFADFYGSGRFDAAAVKARLDLTRFSRDFHRVLKNCPPMVGSVYLDVMTKNAKDGVALTAFAKLSDLALEMKPGQRSVVPQGTFKFAGVIPMKAKMPEREIRDATFGLTFGDGQVTGGWTRFVPANAAKPVELRGFSVSGDMEIACIRRLLGGFISVPVHRQMTAWQGGVVANATAEAAGGTVKAKLNAAGQKLVSSGPDGEWRVPDIRLAGTLTKSGAKGDTVIDLNASGCGMRIRDGETVFAEKAAALEGEAVVAADGTRIRLPKVKISSSLFDASAEVEVTDLANRCVVTAKGQTAVDFAAVTDLLAARGMDEFTLTGKAARDFRFSSPTAGGLATVLAEGELTGAARAASLKGMGLTAGPADLDVKLHRGVLSLSYVPALNGGQLRCVPAITVGGKGGGTMTFPEKTRLLENVTLTQEMADNLLIRVNPLFQGSSVLGGTVTVDLRHCRVDSGAPPDKGLFVDMDVLLKQFRLQMGPSLLELLSMIRVKERVYAADRLPIHVTVKDGRVNVDPVRMVIDRQPVVFSGWVAFDGQIHYLIEVPITDRLVGGAAGKILRGNVIKIPVSGTVAAPQLDTSALKSFLGGLIKNTVGDQALEKVGSFLEKLQQELQK